MNTDRGLVPVCNCDEHREEMIYRIRGGEALKGGGMEMEGWKSRMAEEAQP